MDSGATEDFINKEFCNKHGNKMLKTKNPMEIYLPDVKPRAMGPVTHMRKVTMDISSHRELATFQVANLDNHEVILGRPWLREHNPTINWKDKKQTFNSERCMTWCLNSSPLADAIPEEDDLEGNLITTLSKVQAKEDQRANVQRVRVERLSIPGRVPTRGLAKVGGHDQ